MADGGSDAEPIILDASPTLTDSTAEGTAASSSPAQEEPAQPPQPSVDNDLTRASAEFLAPWGLNYLADSLRKAVQEKELDSFILSLPTDKPAAKNLRIVPLQERPPEGKILVTYFPWQRLTGTGDQWIALWQPPVEITRFTRRYSGDEILELQKRLQLFGFYNGGLDGVVGPGSVQAITEFQQSRGLKASGTPDQQTLLWLYLDDPENDTSPQGQDLQTGDLDPSTPPPEPEERPFRQVTRTKPPTPPLPKQTRSDNLDFTPGNQLPQQPEQNANTVRIRPKTSSSKPAQTPAPPVLKKPRTIPNTNQ